MSLAASIRTGLYGAMQPVGSATVTGTAATSLTVDRLDLTSDGSYFVEISLKNNTASNANISFQANTDSTAANYREQLLTAYNTTISGARATDAICCYLSANGFTEVDARLKRAQDGKLHARFDILQRESANIVDLFGRHVALGWNSSVNLTGFSLVSSVANALAVGSYIKVYKIGAPVTHGIAFPTSGLVDGQRYFRDDLGLDCFYKASINKWLTAQLFSEAWEINGVTVSTDSGYRALDPTYQTYVERIQGTGYVQSANTLTAGWDFSLKYENPAVVNSAVLYSTRTTPDANVSYVQHTGNAGILIPTTATVMYVSALKVSTPGLMYQRGNIYYRKVIP